MMHKLQIKYKYCVSRHPEYRRWFFTIDPWAAVGLFFLPFMLFFGKRVF
jgi:hypothetical protein